MPNAKMIDGNDKNTKLKRVKHPTPLKPADFQHILPLIAQGISMKDIAKKMKFNMSAWYHYVSTVGESERKMLDSALAYQADAHADRVLDVVNRISNEELNFKDAGAMMTGLKWLAAKRNPNTYGDHVKHEHNVKVDIGAVIIDARNRLKNATIDNEAIDSVVMQGGPDMEVIEGPGHPKKG